MHKLCKNRDIEQTDNSTPCFKLLLLNTQTITTKPAWIYKFICQLTMKQL